MERITLGDRNFEIFLPNEQIVAAIDDVARRINSDYAEVERPLFLGILNGSFMFMGELMQRIEFPCEVSFVKIGSYSGTDSTGSVRELIGLGGEIRGRHVVVVEDIVDTGGSIAHIMNALSQRDPASVSIASLLFKPGKYREEYEIKYPALSIPDDFIVGFGLDYNELGRNLRDIYKVTDGK